MVGLLQVLGEAWFYVITNQIMSRSLFDCAFILLKMGLLIQNE